MRRLYYNFYLIR